MNDAYLLKALEVIKDKNVLVNLAAKRAGELSRGASPMLETPANTVSLDIALYEIGEGKIKVGAPKN